MFIDRKRHNYLCLFLCQPVKTSGEGVYVNGVLSGARTGTTNFTAYISPYTVVGNGGQMSKHIYMGSQRIVSKLCNSGTMADPTADIKAGAKDFTAKYALQTGNIKVRYDSLGVTYRGKDNAGVGFYTAANSAAKENLQYFYHSDHLGSSSLITDIDGNVAQHIEYIPFGEVFVEERNNSWKTPYKFNSKELDEETGLYYYGARYMDPRTSVWISVDPLAEKYPSISSYVYCADNPVKFIDPDGRDLVALNAPKGAGGAGHMAILIQHQDGTWGLWSKNGTNENHGSSGPNDKSPGPQKGVGNFKTPQEFLKSNLNPVNKETGKREYTEGYLIQSTKKEDRAAEKGANVELSKKYNVLGSNCATTVQSALSAAGKDDGSASPASLISTYISGSAIAGPVGGAAAATAVEKTPNLIYQRIKKENNGKVVK